MFFKIESSIAAKMKYKVNHFILGKMKGFRFLSFK